MTIVILVFAIWGASALIRASRQVRAEKARAAAQAQREEEARQMREEWRKRQADAKAEVDCLVAIEREQLRQRRELERQAREQARQAEQLARHEERIARLEQQVTLAEREIAHYQPIVDELRAEYDRLSGMIERYEARGLPCGGYRAQFERVNDKLYRAETKVIKAEFAKSNAEQKMIA